ncbi:MULTISPECIES: diaminobutyrate--2-oxoglutarate transaminase [Sinobaca]|uniref:Diaminobutyrate--2-oxoglutarate transaminase n=2 Tax=Sinobaca TaxID=342943 RepID=A0A419UZD5_9BACL|nr:MULTISPECIES: diaminobutyrate--2-oxoglutarate transaminase [Sinobaca]RKD71057.1 diaminobutyrate aminotransferase [Sinobaca qinghaiensis]WAA19451.1 diaminobutyrate--2-oxoglutarate transaminase [Sinobaca sp.]
MNTNDLSSFNNYESEVRSYVRGFPTVFHKAKGYKLWDMDGKEYVDFFSGAGALNYGHNDEKMKQKVIEYIQEDGVIHSLDMASKAKAEFLEAFHDIILKPRSLDYKIMFPGPTGTNTVEAALKLARKVTGRTNVVSFTNGFHGMTIGALSVTGNAFKRKGAGIPLNHTVSMPYDKYLGANDLGLEYFERFLEDGGSGLDKPAAVILETVQGEGGLNAARMEWIKEVDRICKAHDILLIIDDVQAGVGRTGTFFSFEPAGIKPDIICLSKSIGGNGSPLALTLIKPEYDKFAPGEHNGTFRGNNLAFVAATQSFQYWKDDALEKNVQTKAERIHAFLEKMISEYPELKGSHRGRGFMQGVFCNVEGLADKITDKCFEHGLIMETAGPNDEVFKLFPPITIDDEGLETGLKLLEQSIKDTVSSEKDAVTS